MHEKTVKRTYLLELAGAIILYALILTAASTFGRPMAEGMLRTVVLVTPMLGFFAMVWVIARHLNRVDEYVRKFTLENIALAAAVTAAATFTYGFLEIAGYEKLSMFIVWVVLCGSFGLVSCVRSWMNK